MKTFRAGTTGSVINLTLQAFPKLLGMLLVFLASIELTIVQPLNLYLYVCRLRSFRSTLNATVAANDKIKFAKISDFFMLS